MNEQTRLTVVGGGQMGRALVGGMLTAKVIAVDQLRLVEPSQQGRDWWARNQPGIAITDLAPAMAESDTVLIAVKPNVVAEVAKQKTRFWNGKLVVSVAAGIGLDALCGWIGHRRVVRVMPNTPCLVRAGMSAYCCGAEVTGEDKAWIESMLGSVGVAVEVAENQMDAVTGLSGSGPAYACLIIESLADGGVLAGLPRPLALQLATQTLLGTAKMIAETGQHPAALKDLVASPGGTTIAGLCVLEQNGLRGALIEAVAAATRKSRELGSSH